MAEEKVKFKKIRPNFKTILQKQKKMEDDEKFAISDSLQTYIENIQTGSGYQNQEKLEKAGIRQEIINFVDNYTIADLDSIKGMEYDDALQLQKSTDKKIDETIKTGQLEPEEIEYIKATVGETNKRLGEVLGVSTRLKFAFRDLKKELKPLKLAARLGITRIPIIGKRVERAIRAEEEGEAEALRIKRGLRKREARGARKEGALSTDTETPSETQQTKTQAKQATAQIMGQDTKTDLFADSEERVEEERESDNQFDTTSNLLEKILEESELTNELLGKKGKDKDGLGGGLAEGVLATLGIQKFVKFVKGAKLAGVGTTLVTFGSIVSAVTATLAAAFALPAFLAFLNRPQGPKELEDMKSNSANLSSSANFEGVLAEDIAEEDRLRRKAIDHDEYNKLVKRGDIDPDKVTLEQYEQAKVDAKVGNRITGYFTGKIKDAKVEKIMQIITSPITNQGDVSTNSTSTDMGSVTYTTDGKMSNVNEMNNSGMEKSVNEAANAAVNNSTANVINQDNSQTTNKTEFSTSSIGASNPNNLAKEMSNIG
tara:strand:- start:480 stop:2108 length:1629 start_codon:yes stop_codon:yes gene_type:complete